MTDFWANVAVAAPDGCWEWQASRDRDGYGRVRWAGRMQAAHRIAYELAEGPIIAGLQIDHLCRNRGCVNPGHLEPVTNLENVRRGARATATHCRNGHPYDDANAYVWTGRRWRERVCRACNRAAQRRRRERLAVSR